jgi:uncharacterized coiled-coil DUF342 family protein
MKPSLSLLIGLSLMLWAGSLKAEEPMAMPSMTSSTTNPWKLLEQQSTSLLEALKKQDIHEIHQLAKSIQKEVVDLRDQSQQLSPELQKQFLTGLDEIGTEAGAIHHNAHQAAWEEALAQQGKLVESLKKVESLAPPMASMK